MFSSLRPTLWPYVNKWNTSQRLPGGRLMLSSCEGAREMLIGQASAFMHESGFFRIGTVPLPKNLISSLRRYLVLALSASERKLQIGDILAPLMRGDKLTLQSWGHWAVREYFRDAISLRRSGHLDRLVDDYFRTSLIPDDIQARVFFRYRTIRRLRREFAKEIELSHEREVPRDLVDVVKKSGLPSLEQGEIFQRLLLSIGGFTGAALEWSLLYASWNRVNPKELEGHVNEVLRLRPPAWRISRTSREDTSIDGHSVCAGEHVMLNVFGIHSDQSKWFDPNSYDPDRWRNRPSPDVFLPFGRGASVCPGRRAAYEALTWMTGRIVDEYSLSAFTKGPPMVRTLIAPPRGFIRLTPRAGNLSFCTRSS